MFRRLFWLLLFLGGYFWVMVSEKEDEVLVQVKNVGTLIQKKWTDLGVKWHIHTFKCARKKT